MNSTHIIKHQVLDITLGSQQDARALQDQLSRLYNNRLVAVIEQVFNECCGNRKLRIDKIEIDLGNIDPRYMEKDIGNRLEENLRTELEKYISNLTTVNTVRAKDELAILEYFLLNGSYPWWFGSNDSLKIEEILLAAIKRNVAGVVSILKKTGKREHARKRMVHRFTEKLLVKIVRLLEPEQAKFVIDYANDLQHLHERQPIVQASAQGFRKAKWEFIFNWMMLERGTVFNTRSFVKSTIRQLAVRYNVQYNDLLDFLIKAVSNNAISFAPRSTLPSILLEIHSEETSEKSTTVIDKNREDLSDRINFLLYYLRHGSVSAITITHKDIKIILSDAMSEDPRVVVQAIKKVAKQPGVIKRLTTTFTDRLIKRMIYISEPVHASFIITYADNLQVMHNKKRIVKAGSSEFGRVKWELVLMHLFTERGSVFNTRAFVESTVRKLAARYNMKYAELLRMFDEGLNVKALPARLRNTLPSIIRSLREDEFAKEEEASVIIDMHVEEGIHAMIHRDALSFFLNNGKLPWWYKSVVYTSITRLTIAMLHHFPVEFSKMLLQAGVKASPHIVINHPDRLVTRIIMLLEPVHGQSVVSHTRALQEVQQQQPIVYERPSVFRNIVMEITLTYLLSDRGSYFNTRSYIRYTLQRLAAHFNLRYIDVLRHIEGAMDIASVSNSPFFVAIAEFCKEESSEVENVPAREHDQEGSEAFPASDQVDDVQVIRLPDDATEEVISRVQLQDEWAVLARLLLANEWEKEDTFPEFIINLVKKDRQYFKKHIAVLFTARIARQNLLRNLPVTYRDKLLVLLSINELSFLSLYSKDIQLVLGKTSINGISGSSLKELFFEFVIGFIGISCRQGEKRKYLPESFLLSLLYFIAYRSKTPVQKLLALFEKELQQVTAELVSQLPTVLSALQKKGILLAEMNRNEKHPYQEKQLTKEKTELTQHEKKALQEEQQEPVETLYVDNAGVVMLAPYLPRYFEMLGLVKDRQFVDDNAASKGIYLLQYLAAGKSGEGQEHLLALNKLLCGRATYWTIEEFQGFTVKETEMTEQMLTAVMRNWDAMKNTLPGSFRESFLQRKAKLHQEENAWKLHVEKKTYDVLLSSLPWSFATIKFPWMEKLIQVEWK